MFASAGVLVTSLYQVVCGLFSSWMQEGRTVMNNTLGWRTIGNEI